MKCSSKHAALVSALLKWFAANARDLPWRRTHEPYAIWISEIMLQQTQVKTVLPYWERWMQALPDIESLANAKPQKIHKLWEGLGYYTRVRNMQRAAQIVMGEHGGKFPDEFDAVLALPGIGRYTAGAICSIAFNQPTPILDGNVIRVLTRVSGIKGDPRERKTNAKLWAIAQELVESATTRFSSSRRKEKLNSKKEQHGANERSAGRPGPQQAPMDGAHAKTSARLVATGVAAGRDVPRSVRWQAHSDFCHEDQSLLTSAATNQKACSHFNQSLMELGALICTPKNPRCSECPLKSNCLAYRERIVHLLPNLPRRAPATARRFVAFVTERDARFLVRQRPAGVVNAHLWEFPNVEMNGEMDIYKVAQRVLGFGAKSVEPMGTIKHTITRYRITLDVFRCAMNGDGTRATNRERWLSPKYLRRLPFTGAHKRILAEL